MPDFHLKQEESLKTTSMYCEAQVKDHPILLILDSGSSGCVVSANFLKEVGVSIDRPSTVLMVGIHGKQKRPLGEVDEFLITVGGKTITSKAVVSEVENYAVIVGNDWMKKARARLDWKECELMIRDGHKKIRIPTEYCKPPNITERIQKKKKPNEKEKEVEEYTSEEETESEKVSEELELCQLCLEVGHNDETCIFKRGKSIETAYLVKEEKEKDFNLELLKKEQEEEMKD
ncbi:25675_t:CDS:2, partial [Gigaspora margarita]